MTVNRVPEVPFAQIANSALRDKRLSFKARGVLALVLSNVGEWRATAEWIERQSDRDHKHAVQTALNELTEYGYRKVRKEQLPDGRIRTVVDWFHESQVFRPTENPVVGESGGRETGGSIEDHSLEHHALEDYVLEQERAVAVRKPVGDDPSFALFWQTYPRKTAKGHARRAWQKAVRQTPAPDIIAGAVRYRDDPNREPEYTALPATWLNGERWLDEPLPSRSSRADQKVSDVQAMITRAAQRDGQLGIGQ